MIAEPVILPRTTPPPREQTLVNAAELARQAAHAEGGEEVGEHVGYVVEGVRTLTHVFTATKSGYLGWYWAVTVARPPRGRTATVSEVNLLPGEQAVLAPGWVPWADRLQPSDVSATDQLPYTPADERLVAGMEASDPDADALGEELAYEVGLGRARVLSPEGRREAAERWYTSDHGPDAPGARASSGQCSTCGFFIPLTGSLRTTFGVCANEWSPDDGAVVSVDHGCGAHSETGQRQRRSARAPAPPVIDELDLEIISQHDVWPEVIDAPPGAANT